MSYHHKLDVDGGDYIRGGSAEQKFKQMITAKWGANVIKEGTRQEDFAHIDFWLKCKSGVKSVDVKARKFLNNVPVFIVEIMCNGGLGWLYGRQTFVAVEKPDESGFLVISVPKLQKWVSSNLALDITANKSESYGRIYAREKDGRRNDLMAMLPWKVAEELKEWEM